MPLTDPTEVALQKPYNKREAALLHAPSKDSPAFGPPGHAMSGGSGEGALLMLAAMPAAMVVAAILGPGLEELETVGAKAYGHLRGESEAKLKAAVPAMTNALAEIRFEETLRQRLADAITARTDSQVVISRSRADIHPAPPEYVRNFYSDLAAQGIDTAIEMEVSKAALIGRGVINPPLALRVELRFRVLRLQEGQELDLYALKYQSRKRRFVEWAQNNAKPFREEIQSCYATLTNQVLKRLCSF